MAIVFCNRDIGPDLGWCDGQQFAERADGSFRCTSCGTTYRGTGKLVLVDEDGNEVGTVTVKEGKLQSTGRSTAQMRSASVFYDRNKGSGTPDPNPVEEDSTVLDSTLPDFDDEDDDEIRFGDPASTEMTISGHPADTPMDDPEDIFKQLDTDSTVPDLSDELPPGVDDTVVFEMEKMVAALEAEAGGVEPSGTTDDTTVEVKKDPVEATNALDPDDTNAKIFLLEDLRGVTTDVDADTDLEEKRFLESKNDPFDVEASIGLAESGDMLPDERVIDEPTAGGTLDDPEFQMFKNILAGSDPHFGPIEGADRPMSGTELSVVDSPEDFSEPEDEEDDDAPDNIVFVGNAFAEAPEPKDEESEDSTASTEGSSEDIALPVTETTPPHPAVIVKVESGRTDRPVRRLVAKIESDHREEAWFEEEPTSHEVGNFSRTKTWLFMAAVALVAVFSTFMAEVGGEDAPQRAYSSHAQCVESGLEENGLNPETMRDHFAAACKEQGYE